jgi:hypothetical protein
MIGHIGSAIRNARPATMRAALASHNRARAAVASKNNEKLSSPRSPSSEARRPALTGVALASWCNAHPPPTTTDLRRRNTPA